MVAFLLSINSSCCLSSLSVRVLLAFSNSLPVNKWRFANKDAHSINAYIDSGFIFEGLPFNIVLADGSNVITLENYLDLVDDAIISCSDVEANSKEKQRIDWLNEVADGFTFDYLHKETNLLPSSLFVPVPYVINAIPNNRDIFLAGLSVFVVVNELTRTNLDIGRY